MPILLAAFTVIVDAIFIYHVIRNQRPYYWAFIILSFPIAGCVAYYLLEIFPNSREHRNVRRAGRNMARALNPDGPMKKRIEEMELCGSVDNKVALAEECLERGFSFDAIKLYRSCLQGAHAKDPALMFGLIHAYVENGAHEEALKQVQSLQTEHTQFRPNEVRLLKARALEAADDTHAALTEYEALLPLYSGLEARCRFGLLLQESGHTQQAQSVFQELLEHAKRFNITLDSEQDWIAQARQALRS